MPKLANIVGSVLGAHLAASSVMTPPKTSPLSPSPSTRSSAWAAALARLRASAWTAVGVKLGAVVVALLVLGYVGRSAAAGPSSVVALEPDASLPALPTVVAVDAGVQPLVTPPPPPPPRATTETSRGRASTEEPVFLNQASVDELRRLPGVGPKRAEAILVLRQRLGRFHRVEDLLRVKGIGRRTVKKWRPLVRLDSPDAGAP